MGEFKNGGREWQPKRTPEAVKTHDFPDKELGKVAPYGVYDAGGNRGWVSVGLDHDTAEFATATISRWWCRMGSATYPEAGELLILADSGGSNSSRTRLWKVALQRLADHIGLRLSICHFPPGTSKWNKIEHRMFSHITANWRGKPLTSECVNGLGAKSGVISTFQSFCQNRNRPRGLQLPKQLKSTNSPVETANNRRASFYSIRKGLSPKSHEMNRHYPNFHGQKQLTMCDNLLTTMSIGSARITKNRRWA